ncbi:GGDEF domain-containing protein [Chromobacterium alticapitis]|uniref:Sensor domain-containing diguanylate cyclase n=1 Tax=Chromobacterium alticapitis TaxID=2073169 RepID=A0A2S5DG18_9NEIS|nr:sensor domain-containing diguanylate cyclase [Chromobacterium alticapitis]POZ61961.1 sensor domain-containing diguanylate cyclase [Chromobacterium alticapitis]
MLAAPIPENEQQRLESLRRMQILSTPNEEAFDRIVRLSKRLFRVPIAVISLIDEHRQWFKSCSGLELRQTERRTSFCGHAILSDELLVVPDASRDERFHDNPLVTGAPGIAFYAGRPIKNWEGFRIGTLCVIDTQPRQLSADDRQSLDDLGAWVEMALANRQLGEAQAEIVAELDAARRQSMLDPLLNIWNRAAGKALLAREAARAERQQGELAVMMIDLDYFKNINDDYGHLHGDRALIEFSLRITSCLRAYDSVARFGGDEFFVILPDTSLAQAEKRAGEILAKIRSSPVESDDISFPLSASIGVAAACFRNAAATPRELVGRADEALLQAKRDGRGNIKSYAA